MPMLRPAFTAAIFTAAFLLFWVQPLFGKMMLPMLGGSPAVWLTAMVFYQGVLLLGYTYAHALTRLPQRRAQVGIHLLLLILAFSQLPFALPADWQPVAADSNPSLAILLMMGSTIGLPLLVLSASSPLLQKWFSDSTTADPYPLYAASNVGSMVSLLLFPLFLEVMFPVHSQTMGWLLGFGVLMALFAVCMGIFVRSSRAVAVNTATALPASSISWQQRGIWLVYAFVPSSLLLGVTQYMTTDIGAVALLWILPLALYLLTFILAFSSRERITLFTSALLHLVLVVPLLASMSIWGGVPSKPLMLLHLAWFFVTTLMCHQVLFRARPAPVQLTQFYLMVSLGGFLGGVFNALVAPLIFPAIWEYLLMVAVAVWLRPKSVGLPVTARTMVRVAAGSFIAALAIYGVLNITSETRLHLDSRTAFRMGATLMFSVIAAYSLWRKPAIGILAVSLFAAMTGLNQSENLLYRERSFFGAYKVRVVRYDTAAGGTYHVFSHGTTLHGTQRQDKNRNLPQSYYHPDGPFGSVMRAARGAAANTPKTIAVTGLGAGALGCMAVPGDSWTYFEIDPMVARVATTPGLFTYLRDCVPNARIVLGDARLTLRDEPSGKFDLIILDAFSSDAIPTHLLTLEALDIYRDKLKPGGMIAYHISNRHLNLRPVVAGLAAARGLEVRANDRGTFNKKSSLQGFAFDPAELVVISERLPDALRNDSRWQDLGTAPQVMWTDDHSNILSVLR
jgi:hypothetical protein